MIQKIKTFFQRLELIVFLTSILFTFIVSAVVGVGGVLISGNFWGYFTLAFGIQFIIFAVINTYLQRKDLVEGTKIITEQLEAASKYTIRLSCAYCKQTNPITIVLNQENRFVCQSCNQVNGVKMQFFSTQITTPLKKVLIPVGDDDSIVFKTDLT